MSKEKECFIDFQTTYFAADISRLHKKDKIQLTKPPSNIQKYGSPLTEFATTSHITAAE